MAKFDPKKHHRRSIRKKGYDYSSPGKYFITIDVNKNLHLFGHVKDGIMIKNDAGNMIEKWYFKIPEKFPDIRCHEMIIMPNHIHFIIENVGWLQGSAPTGVDTIIQWFKTMSTNEYIRGVKEKGWPRFIKKLWHRNFFDRIIRDERMLQNITNYIINNPKKWNHDPL